MSYSGRDNKRGWNKLFVEGHNMWSSTFYATSENNIQTLQTDFPLTVVDANGKTEWIKKKSYS